MGSVVIGQRWEIYPFNIVKDRVPKRGEIVTVTNTPDFETGIVQLTADGNRTVLELYEGWKNGEASPFRTAAAQDEIDANLAETAEQARAQGDAGTLEAAVNYTNMAILQTNNWLPPVKTKAELQTAGLSNQRNYLCKVVADPSDEELNGVYQAVAGWLHEPVWVLYDSGIDMVIEEELAAAMADHNVHQHRHDINVIALKENRDTFGYNSGGDIFINPTEYDLQACNRTMPPGSVLRVTGSGSGVIFGHIPDKPLNNVDNARQIPMSEKGQPGGVATLDGNGKVPAAQLPELGGAAIPAGGWHTVSLAAGLPGSYTGSLEGGGAPFAAIHKGAGLLHLYMPASCFTHNRVVPLGAEAEFPFKFDLRPARDSEEDYSAVRRFYGIRWKRSGYPEEYSGGPAVLVFERPEWDAENETCRLWFYTEEIYGHPSVPESGIYDTAYTADIYIPVVIEEGE